MANPQAPEESALEAFWRSTIMLGTLIVGGMAAYLYGPPPEKAAAMIDQLVGRVQELLAEPPAPPMASAPPARLPAGSPDPPPPAPSGLPALTPLAGFPNRSAAPLANLPPASVPAAALAPLVSELTALGASDFDVQAWGSGADLHRFHCTAPLLADGGGSGFRRHFQAIGRSPVAAAAEVLADVRQWRSSPPVAAQTASGWR